MTIRPPEPIIEPICDEVVVIDRRIQILGRDTAAGRTAGLGCLELLAVRDAAADLLHDLPQGGAHGHFHQAGVMDLAAQSEYLGTLALLGADGSGTTQRP